MFLGIFVVSFVFVEGCLCKEEQEEVVSVYKNSKDRLFFYICRPFAVFLRKCKLVIFPLFILLCCSRSCPCKAFFQFSHQSATRFAAILLALLFLSGFQHGKESFFISCFAQNHHSEDTNQSGNEVIVVQAG